MQQQAHYEVASFTDITSYMTHDHHRLGILLAEVAQDVAHDRVAVAGETFADFRSALERHMRIEEELLFPLFEIKTGLSPGPTVVMRDEHREIRRALRIIGEGLSHADLTMYRDGLAYLGDVLPGHEAKEERVLYPLTDRALSGAESARLVARLVSEP